MASPPAGIAAEHRRSRDHVIEEPIEP